MKAKTSRRYLARNAWKIKANEIEKEQINSLFGFIHRPKSYIRHCLKILRQDIKETKNPASIRCINNFLYR